MNHFSIAKYQKSATPFCVWIPCNLWSFHFSRYLHTVKMFQHRRVLMVLRRKSTILIEELIKLYLCIKCSWSYRVASLSCGEPCSIASTTWKISQRPNPLKTIAQILQSFFRISLLAKNQETENDNNNTMRGLVLRDLSGMLKFKRISIQLCVFLLSGFNLVSGNIFLEKCISIAVVLNTFTKWFCKYSNYHETPS